MRLCTPVEMKEVERLSEIEFKLEPEILMESAGALAAREVQLSFLPELTRGRLAVVCGPGNNGGDGLVLARHLYSQGFLATEVFIVGEPEAYGELFKLQLTRAEKQGLKITFVNQHPESLAGLKDFGVIVDGIFGIGISRDVEGLALEAIRVMNASQSQVVSLDIPSGLCGLTGKIFGAAVRANMTLTFGLAKPGLIAGEGPECSGRVRVIQIGFPRRLFRDIAKTHFTFNERLARRWLPVRKRQSNKARNGHLLVVAGHEGMWGAASLCTEAAYRMGVGYVTLAVPKKEDAVKSLVHEMGAEVLTISRDEPSLLEKKTAVVLGPGAGVDTVLRNLIERLANENFRSVLLDADALTVLADMKGIKLPSTWLLTPHSGELSRLLKVSSEQIDSNRFYFASVAAKKFGCNVLLKGYRSLLADPEDRIAVITSGNAALAKAGTGDVLSGMIGALLAQGAGTIQAGGTAAYLHGRSADDWVRAGRDAKSFMPRDILAMLPELLVQISRE